MDRCQSFLARVAAPLVECLSFLLRIRRRFVPPPQPGVAALPIRATSEAELEAIFRELQEGSKDFAQFDWRSRADLARECLEPMLGVHHDVAAACAAHKGTAETGLGEELLAFTSTFSALRQFAASLESEGTPPLRGVRQLSRVKAAVRAFPSSLYEHLLFPGWRGEVMVKTNAVGQPSQGTLIRQRVASKSAPVCVQLAAGNQASVVTCDIIEKVFGEGCVCLVKMNPVNEYLGPILEQGFAPLVDRKLLRFVYGPVSVASQCIDHGAMEELHMTGSDRTYNMIQWGCPTGPPEPDQDKPKITKNFTAELGACTPYIICPGQWSEQRLRDYARSIVSMKVHNAGCNCLSPQILVTSKSWGQRAQFLDLIREEFRRVQTRRPWYPGAADRLRRLIADSPQVECFPAPAAAKDETHPFVTDDSIDGFPWLFLPDVSTSPAPTFFREEFFAGALAEVSLDSSGPEEFLHRAVDFVNGSLWGTLSCALFVPPSVSEAAVEEAVENLQYGSINVNTVTAMSYSLVPCTWGGYAGHTPKDIQSGMGAIHNALFLDNVEKSVMWAPWGSLPYTPFWYYTHANAENLGQRIGVLFAYFTFLGFVKTAISGVRG